MIGGPQSGWLCDESKSERSGGVEGFTEESKCWVYLIG